METFKGTVKRIIFENRENGYKVAKIKLSNGPQISVDGEMGPEIIVGTVAAFHGDFKTHHKYGPTFKVASYDISHNAEELLSIELFIDAIAPNIGHERAHMIVDHFGAETIDILDKESSRLIEVPGIGKISAESLAAAWKEKRAIWEEDRQQYSVRAFLNNLGIKEGRVKKILKFFGGGLQAEEKIRKNPYILTHIEGIGFSTADFVARQLGISEDDPDRLEAYIYYVIDILCPGNGHLYLNIEDIKQACIKFCSESNTTFIHKKIFSLEDMKISIGSLENKGLVINDGGNIYGQDSFVFEKESAAMLSAVIKKPSDLILLNREVVNEYIAEFESLNNITLSSEQRKALYYFIEYKVFILTGAAGSGKTTCLKAIVYLINHLKLNLVCMTPTGISAKKMESTIGYPASTIHRRLGFRGTEWTFGENNKLEADVVIIDETSMVDMEVFYHLFSALTYRTHLIFVGDDNQLPSVGAGNVLKELITSGNIPVVKLDQIFRQSETSDIIKAAHRIKNGDTNLDLFKSDPKADIFFIREKDTDKIESYIIKLAMKFKEEKRLFQVITARNNGPLSVDVLNNSLQKALNPPGIEKEISCGGFILRRGDRIIIKKNDYELGVFNGEIGKVVFIGEDQITIRLEEKDVEIGKDEINSKIKLAYTLSTHKSQGQEYPFIILPFVNQFGKNMLQRNLLYTAITRAKKKVIVMGHGSALEKAINNASVSKRNTKLGDRIKVCLQTSKKDFSEILQGVLEISQDALSEEELF